MRFRSDSGSWTSPGLRPALRQLNGNELEIVMLLARGMPSLESIVDASNLALFCTPAVNLFEKRADRIHVSEGSYEYHVVPDRARPMDFEVYEVQAVQGFGTGAGSEQEFRPFYAAYTGDSDDGRIRPTSPRGASRGCCRRRRSGGARARATSAARCSCRSSTARARRSAATCASSRCGRSAPTATSRCRCRWAWQVGPHPRRVAPVARIRVVGGPSRPYGAAGRRGGGLEGDQSPVAELSGARGFVARWRARPRCATCSSSMRRPPIASARKQIDAIRSVSVNPAVARLPPARDARRAARARLDARVRARPGRRAWKWTSSRSRAAAPSCSAPCCSTTSPGPCRSIRSPKPTLSIAGSRADQSMGATVGREADALDLLRRAGRRRRTASTSTRRCGGSSVCTRASRAGARRCGPADEPVRLGQEPDLAFAPAPLRLVRSARDAGRACEVRLFGLLGPNGPAAAAPHRVRAGAAAAEQRSDVQPFPRSLPPPVYGAVLSRLGAGAAARQSRPARRRSVRRLLGRVHRLASPAFHRRDAVADPAKLHHAGWLVRHGPQRRRARRDPAAATSACRCGSQEFVGHWLPLGADRADVSRRVSRRGSAAEPSLGARVWDRQHKFRLHIGPLTASTQYESFLPGGRRLRELVAWVRAVSQFRIGVGRVPAASSGSRCRRLRFGEGRRLGWTTWLGNRRADEPTPKTCA